jgi:hypothetical protein
MIAIVRPFALPVHIPDERHPMSKRARKRRSRKGNKANHGRKPNA